MRRLIAAAALAAACLPPDAAAESSGRADAHAPIGVMADHFHNKGEWMFSYRFMTMTMDGNRQGTDRIDPDTIVTTEANRFAGLPGQPPTLRIVPIDMTMDMHMLGAMYAPHDRLTLMVMANYWQKSMEHLTYQGGMGTEVLGNFNTATSGWSDTTVNGLINFLHDETSRIHGIVGVSLPTGSTTETDDILTPMNMRPTVRVPYPMQLGSGTFDPILGLSYAGFASAYSWGAQWRSTFRLQDNDENYRLGDEHRFTGWFSYLFADGFSASLRVEHFRRGNIEGLDPRIVGPVQTADPGRQGGSRTDLAAGINLAGSGRLSGWRLAFEYTQPVRQDLDGPQLEVDRQFVVGIQRAIH